MKKFLKLAGKVFLHSLSIVFLLIGMIGGYNLGKHEATAEAKRYADRINVQKNDCLLKNLQNESYIENIRSEMESKRTSLVNCYNDRQRAEDELYTCREDVAKAIGICQEAIKRMKRGALK